jgi:hypothetical protein
MKKRNAVRAITRILKNWEGSQLNDATSREILNKLEKLGLKPPSYKIIREWPQSDGWQHGHWEKE